MVARFGDHEFLKLGALTRGFKIRKPWLEGLEAPSSENWAPKAPRLRRCRLKVWEAAVLQIGSPSSKMRKHWFKVWEPAVLETEDPMLQGWGASSSQNREAIGFKVWEPAILQTRSPWFEDWEALVRRSGGR